MADQHEPKAHAITMIITGALRDPIDGAALQALLQRVERAVLETWPDFLPGNPVAAITTSELRDDWIKR